MINQFAKYYFTIRDLKLRQVIHQVKRRLLPPSFKPGFPDVPFYNLKYSAHLSNLERYDLDLKFTFLNQSHEFDKTVKWDFMDHGLLWNYNLNYFDYLCQDQMTKDVGLALIHSFIDSKDGNYDAYPVSLRIMNWIWFFSKHEIKDVKIIGSLHRQVQHLASNLEYHLMGNHLLENGFALLHGAYFFRDSQFYQSARKLLQIELEEQVLSDGAHFELSPMYHRIILQRLLGSIDILRNNSWENVDQQLLLHMNRNASLMLGWMREMTLQESEMPHLNDSAIGIAAGSEELLEYAEKIGLYPAKIALGESGYRKSRTNFYEMIMDLGPLGPKYIPGHSHCDIGSFILCANGHPSIVDTGTSTYEKNKLRFTERSTKAHNTVQYGNEEQSQIWGGFRVGRKAKILDVIEMQGSFEVKYKGFKRNRIEHARKFTLSDKSIVIEDHVNRAGTCYAYFHFHPDENIWKEGERIRTKHYYIDFNNVESVLFEEYEYAIGFNIRKTSTKLKVIFVKNMTAKLYFNENTVSNR